jgi:uridine phosphorylase
MRMAGGTPGKKRGASRMPEVPLLYGSPGDRSLTNPEDWVFQLRKAGRLRISSLPKRCVLTFRYMDAEDVLRSLGYRMAEVDLAFKKAWTLDYGGIPVCLFPLSTGAPSAGLELEILLALGVEYAILVGGVGVFDSELSRWTVIVPNRAIRDEGTSYQYERPSPYALPSPSLSSLIKEVLRERGLRFVEGAVWTTDGFFRETRRKREAFILGGAVCVDMEASALFSIARFRWKDLAAVFYAGDYVGDDGWDLRIEEGHEEKRRRISGVLLEAALETLRRVKA